MFTDALAETPGWKANPLNPGETAAVSFRNAKTAALCYDRIWYPWIGYYPEEVRFAGEGRAEVHLGLNNLLGTLIAERKQDAMYCPKDVLRTLVSFRLPPEELPSFLGFKNPTILDWVAYLTVTKLIVGRRPSEGQLLRYFCRLLRNQSGIAAVPVYNEVIECETEFASRGKTAQEVVLSTYQS